MLFYQTIDASTLELLKVLQRITFFKNLRLVGGTSLALQIGHRKSIDLDFFGTLQIDENDFSHALSIFDQITWIKKSEHINIFSINNIKVDFVNYKYPWIEEKKTVENLNLAGLKDIAAMKLAAIIGRGTKKDFIDIYFLLQHFSLSQMIDFYKQKYDDGSVFLVLKSLTYFDDANQEQEPVMLKSITWQNIKKGILKEQLGYVKNL